MDMDPDVANWVLDFLLRQPLEDRTLKSLLRVLPLRDTDLNLKKLILLKKLESDASNDSISEETLQSLEQLGEMGFPEGIENVAVAMRQAYCAVAVVSSVRALANQDTGDELSRTRYFEMVKRVWKGRLGRMNKATGTSEGLGSNELWAWKKEIKAGLWDDNARHAVMKKSMEVNAVEAIENYLRVKRENMGPSFLELMAGRMKSDEFLQGAMLGVGTVDRVAEKVKCCPGVSLIEDNTNGDNEIQKEKVHLRNKVVARRHSSGSKFGCSRRARLVDSDEIATSGPSCRNYNLPSSAYVNRVKESLLSSELELRAVVKDPLPEAVKHAKAISNEVEESKHHKMTQDNSTEANVVDGAGVDQPIDCHERQENGCHDHANKNCNANNTSRPSLMERNASAHIFEWDDSIDRSQDGPADSQERLLLPSPRVLNATPLRRYQDATLKRRRQPRKWSSLEEDALREGVQKYGKGNWKFILSVYRDKFENRTDVDLKDKWRNMTRS